MKSLRALIAVLVSLAVGGAASASPAAAASGAAPRSALTNFECVKAVDAAARAVGVTAVMRPLGGTEHMQMRVELLEKVPGSGGYSAVSGQHFGAWLSPTPPTLGQRPGDVWNVPDEVAELPAPATYKFRVSYRWIGRSGRVIQTTTRVSPLCQQPQLEPDLTVSNLAIAQVRSSRGTTSSARSSGISARRAPARSRCSSSTPTPEQSSPTIRRSPTWMGTPTRSHRSQNRSAMRERR